MKKLTKRVQAGGLWFDVPCNTQYLAIHSSGMVDAYTDKPYIATESSQGWCQRVAMIAGRVVQVDLGGADWRECCWYVGDQVDGEAAERREWMARGVDGFERYCVHLSDCSGDKRWIGAARNAALYANTIRSGEVDV